MNRPFKILIAPLDWGLGHATRCMPLIRYLLEKQCEVTVAAEGAAALLLRSNFQHLTIIPIEGYNIRYSRSAGTFTFRILMQVPKILGAIRKEKRWLIKIQRKYQFDLIISDNRYGLKTDGLISVIMTHQLQIKSGAGQWMDKILLHMHSRVLGRFDQCWVVDNQGENGIGGVLSHPAKIPSNARYIGILSQLTRPARQDPDKDSILVLLSGPEPQRSLLEQKILSGIAGNPQYHYTVVGGNPGGPVPDELGEGVDYYTHLNTVQLEAQMQKAGLVICRSGYSTLMDLAVFGKKALLIPTPGQSEQEYLARNLSEKGLFFSTKQSVLDLRTDISKAFRYPGFNTFSDSLQHEKMKEAVDEILEQLSRACLV